jgi:DNA mismatch endonuclease, patch repair protein
MTDVHNSIVRSYNMSQIKSKDTKPEILVRKFLFSMGFRFKLHDNKLPGKPDIILPKLRTVIFVNGCFWHGHQNCNYYVVPKTRTDFWVKKIEENRQRDIKNFSQLKEEGWNVLSIFECELKNKKKEQTFSTILDKLTKTSIANIS